MRFIDPSEEELLNRLVTEGAVNRDVLGKAVGDRTVSLIEALAEHADQFPSPNWVAWGIRQGHARVNHTKVTPVFIRELKLSEDDAKLLAEAWFFPFARNDRKQMLVACVPGCRLPVNASKVVGENPVLCIPTLLELRELHAEFAKAW